jgi:hypothetical protein
MVSKVMNPPEKRIALRPGHWVVARKGQLVSCPGPRSAFDVGAGRAAYSDIMKLPVGSRFPALFAVAF